MMRLCVPIPCFFGREDFCDALRKVQELGYSAAETYSYQNLDRKKVRKTCEETGVKLVSMCTTNFELTRPEFRNDFLSGLAESAKAAHEMNVGKLITQVGNDCGRDRRYQHESIVEGLRGSIPILEQYGVTLMIEPLNTQVDHPGYYLSRSDEAFEIIREVHHPLVKVVFDIYHQQITEGNIIPNIERNIEHIAHFHCASNPGRHEFYRGEIDYHNVFSAISHTGYDGYCGLEYTPTLPFEYSLRLARAFGI